ncbi:response regulator [Salinimonas sediminis]|uniref:Response regulator n=1 Tax=Salinimonas sediminis TaxID=2303538 RepID=A0A346NMZ0_9ALTE|nr:response regulator [Salinimonas sediminis]AXR06897.1 response regulator [Salinimonas sediminis]
MERFPPLTPDSELRILIIDNQGLVHDQVTSALREINITKVSSALNAFHAVRMCEQHTFDFILIAFNISHDKDGFHLLEELRHNNHITQKTTVIFLSAETSPELVNCIVEMQPDDFWVKPLDRKRIEARLVYLLSIRKKLHKLLHCLHQRDFSAAIYHAQRQLLDTGLSEFHPRLKRIIGDCLMQLREYAEAEAYYLSLLNTYDYAWIHIGLVKALLRQDQTDTAEPMMEDLLGRRDTQFQVLDLLAQYHLENEQYEQAYEHIKQASQLAPRNIERNKKLWDLARLNHDKVGQLTAVQNMARYAKNSIHDSPQLGLNVVRATVDLATGLAQPEAEKLLKKVEQDLDLLGQSKATGAQFEEQLSVIRARMLCLRNDKQGAQHIMNQQKPELHGMSMEDNLDKMKAFHELGMKEHCLSLLDKLRSQIEGDTFSSQVVDEYLKQESIERREISFTTKELKEMAAVNYKENRMQPAYNNLRQALTLSPQNRQIAFSLLKVLVQLAHKEALTNGQVETMQQAAMLLCNTELPAGQLKKREEYFALLKIDPAALYREQAGAAAPGLAAGAASALTKS